MTDLTKMELAETLIQECYSEIGKPIDFLTEIAVQNGELTVSHARRLELIYKQFIILHSDLGLLSADIGTQIGLEAGLIKPKKDHCNSCIFHLKQKGEQKITFQIP